MAEINEIVSKAAIDDIIRLNESFIKLDSNMSKILNNSKTLTDQLNKTAQSTATTEQKAKEYNVILDQTAANQKELVSQQKQLETSQAKLNTIQSDTNQELLKLKRQLSEENELLKLNTIMTDKNSGTLEKAAAYNRVLEKEKKKLDLTTKEGTARLKEINEQQDKNNELIAVGANKLQAQKINIGNYKSALSDLKMNFLSGNVSAGELAKGIANVGKQMIITFITNPILLAIGAIVGAVAGLYKAFKSTDSGATELAAKFERLKAIFDVLRQGFAGFANGIVAFFSGDKQKANEEFAASFKNIGERMKEAANAGEEYIKKLDTIEDSEANFISRSADLQNQIAKLEYTAQDRTKSTAERKAALEEALKLGQEEVNERKRIAEEKFNNEAKYLAAKNGITQQDLISFIKMSDSEQLTASEGVKAARNNNEEKFKNLEELYANMINADTKYFEENKRNLSRMTGFLEQENKAREQAAQKAAQKAAQLEEARAAATTKAFEREYEMQLLLIKASGLSKEEQEAKTFELKKQYLQKTLDLLQIELNAVKGNELEKIKIQERINDERAKLDGLVIEKRVSDNEIAGTKMMSSEEMMNKRKADQESKYGTDLVATTQAVADQKQMIAESELNDFILKQEEKNEILKAGQEAAIQIQGSLLNFFIEGYQNDLEKLEQKNAAGLLSDKEYAQQKAEIEIKQAKAKKLQGAFETTINTAAAIIGMLKDPGGVAGTIMAVAAGITGGLQLTSILSAPLPTMPAFADGTTNAPALGLAGEAGTELGITKTGEAILFDKPTVFKGSKFKGMHIYSNPEFEAMKAMNNFNYVSDNTAIVSKLESLEKTIKDKPVFIFDKDKNIVGMVKSNHIERYINRYK